MSPTSHIPVITPTTINGPAPGTITAAVCAPGLGVGHAGAFIEQIEHLMVAVGARITAAGAGVDFAQLVAYLNGEPPDQDVITVRVAVLEEVVAAITAFYPGPVAASFLRSNRPGPDERALVALIGGAGPDTMPAVMTTVRAGLEAFLTCCRRATPAPLTTPLTGPRER